MAPLQKRLYQYFLASTPVRGGVGRCGEARGGVGRCGEVWEAPPVRPRLDAGEPGIGREPRSALSRSSVVPIAPRDRPPSPPLPLPHQVRRTLEGAPKDKSREEANLQPLPAITALKKLCLHPDMVCEHV
jgi:hypothetical protein